MSINLLDVWELLSFPAPFCVSINAGFPLPTRTIRITVLICPTPTYLSQIFVVSEQIMNNLNFKADP